MRPRRDRELLQTATSFVTVASQSSTAATASEATGCSETSMVAGLPPSEGCAQVAAPLRPSFSHPERTARPRASTCEHRSHRTSSPAAPPAALVLGGRQAAAERRPPGNSAARSPRGRTTRGTRAWHLRRRDGSPILSRSSRADGRAARARSNARATGCCATQAPRAEPRRRRGLPLCPQP